ncbi:MAG: hypothetical protein Rhob2KO_27010 [Rhodopirellula baltica]
MYIENWQLQIGAIRCLGRAEALSQIALNNLQFAMHPPHLRDSLVRDDVRELATLRDATNFDNSSHAPVCVVIRGGA